MSNDTQTYNGWTNYETWCVHLWLSNEEGSYRYWREEAERHQRRNRDDARNILARQLKSELEEASPLEEASLFSDLLNAALSEVDWYEVADAFLEDLEPDDEPDGDTEGEETDPDDEGTEEPDAPKQEEANGPKGPCFELGQVVATPGALETLTPEDIANALARHHRGDWGECGPEDWRENDTSLREGFRLFSVYQAASGVKFWVITEADRSVTTVLLPCEY